MYDPRKVVKGLHCSVVIQGELKSPVECSMCCTLTLDRAVK